MKEKGFDGLRKMGMKVLPFYLFTFLLFIACMMSGCIEEYEADIPSEDSGLLVVEGTICSAKVNTFFLSRTLGLNSSDIPQRVLGAIVSVRGSDGSEYVALPTNGYYACKIDSLAPDVDYYLHIEYDGEVYESEPQQPIPTEKIADVRGVQPSPESNIDVLVTPDTPFEPDKTNYYSWTYDETWEVRPIFEPYVYFDTEALAPVFITSNPFPVRGWIDATSTTIMVGASTNYEGQHIQRLKMYDIDRGGERIYYRYSGLIHQRAISKAEYEYEIARRQAGSEMGGLFTPQPSALPTNIHCLTSGKRVIGFVGCSLNTSEYRFFLNPADYSILFPRLTDALFWFDNCNEMDCLRQVMKGLYLCVWEDNRMTPGGTLRTAWASLYQLDVRQRGAYIEPPVFW